MAVMQLIYWPRTTGNAGLNTSPHGCAVRAGIRRYCPRQLNQLSGPYEVLPERDCECVQQGAEKYHIFTAP